MKRADITDAMICRAYARARREGDPIAIIAAETGAPYKMAWRAAERAMTHGLINYGVSLRGGWLTEKGIELIK